MEIRTKIQLVRRHGFDVYEAIIFLNGGRIRSSTYWSEGGARQWLADNVPKYISQLAAA